MRFYSVLNFKKHFFSAVKQRCTLHFLHITLGVPLHPGTLHLPFLSHNGKSWLGMGPASLPLIAQRCPEATKRKTEFLNMQNKIIKPDKSLLYTFTHTHTYFLCTVHVILSKITKANNLAFFSHHVLLWPCVRTGRPTFKWCLIVTPTPYWTVLWYFSNILIGCNHLKNHALNMGH